MNHLSQGMTKTNAARLLDSLGIKYKLVAYEVDENDLGAISVASKLGQDIEQVFKTLVLLGDKSGIVVAVISGNEEVDLKKLAKVSSNKAVEMVAMKKILELTGYIRGGCSPIGMKKKYPVFIHETCILFDYIYISAGMRGLQLKIAPDDLIKVTQAKIAEIV
jgi:Cys-tRNA(Pro)/Cys-tRNA(Cys) deacylase